MSQIFKTVASTPIVATSYVTDSGTAVPAANILNVVSSYVDEDYINGIRTTGSGNTVTVELTNRLYGAITTTDATPSTLITYDLTQAAAVANGSYTFSVMVTAHKVVAGVTTDALSYWVDAGFKIAAGVATRISTDLSREVEDGALTGASIDFDVSGTNAVVTVTGVAATNISWGAFGTYVFV